MTISLRNSFCLFSLLVSGACATTTHSDPAQSVAAADALDRQFIAAFNKGDLEALCATYLRSPELVSIGFSGTGDHGWDAVHSTWQKIFGEMKGAKLEMPTMRNVACGDVMMGYGTFRITMPTPNGPQILEGRYSDVKAMRNGRWVYVMDHASVPMAAPK